MFRNRPYLPWFWWDWADKTDKGSANVIEGGRPEDNTLKHLITFFSRPPLAVRFFYASHPVGCRVKGCVRFAVIMVFAANDNQQLNTLGFWFFSRIFFIRGNAISAVFLSIFFWHRWCYSICSSRDIPWAFFLLMRVHQRVLDADKRRKKRKILIWAAEKN